MNLLARFDGSRLNRWWWSVDRWTLGAVGLLLGVGYMMMLTSTPGVAERIGSAREAFILKQMVFLAVAGAVVVAASLLTPSEIKRVAVIGCAGALAFTALTLLIGQEIKGARRWIQLPGMTLQPSEFLKPFFAVTAALLIAEGRRRGRCLGMLGAFGLLVAIVGLLKLQPDIGMLAVLVAVFVIQLFVNGLHWVLVIGTSGLVAAGGPLAYWYFPHFRLRVDKFWSSSDGSARNPGAQSGADDKYQIYQALEALGNGGLLGRGPGEGLIKDKLPDAHADFVFAVLGEEFGLIACLLLLAVFAFIVLRGLARMTREHDPFVVLACTGLIAGFGLQAFINMASTVELIPTKGMTLPLISYGGSSAIAVAVGLGMLLALTRRRHREEPS
jgi:cell division protein FtsW